MKIIIKAAQTQFKSVNIPSYPPLKNYLILIISFFIVRISVAQEKIESVKPQIVRHQNKRNSQIEKIIFKDSQGNAIREFDVEQNNPFKQASGEIVEIDNGRKIYKAEGKKIEDLASNISHYENQDAAEEHARYFTTQVNEVLNGNSDLTGLVYNFKILNAEYGELGSQARFKFFNSEGKVKQELNLETDANSFIVTNNDKYLGFTFGGIVNSSGYQVFDEGFSIYDINTGEKTLEVIAEDGYRVASSRVRHNFLVFVFHGNDRKFFIIDPELKIIYSKNYNKVEKSRLKLIAKDGLIFKDNEGIDRLDSYEEVFTKETF